ncbi:sensor histidine kinase [Kitasatospora sp. McL0602]|uniref:sensor histidine kinase n=1 Tax=Kitasatospora sp. McL0602 TaxID=3439530 RepID=UPI003F8A028F
MSPSTAPETLPAPGVRQDLLPGAGMPRGPGGMDVERVARWQREIAGRGRAGLGRVNPYLADSLLAVFSAAVSVWGVYHDDQPGWPLWVYLLAVSTALPLPWRRRRPGTVMLLCSLSAAVLSVVAHSAQPQVEVYMVLCIYTLADRGRDWQRWSMLVFLVLANVLGTYSINGMLFSVMMSVGSFVFGSLVRQSRRLAALERERAHDLGLRAASEAARAVAEERSRIAREMHDILAHAVSLMVIQAEAGPVVVRSDPERAIRAFDTIADSGRDAMVQLRRVLGVLKEDGAGPVLAPQPKLAELAAVVERVRGAGIAVRLELPGPALPGQRTMPPDVETAAYRIVQEALTNTVKHSGAGRAVVRLALTGDALEVAVSDDGRGSDVVRAEGWSGGRGLVGIRERAAACGGRAWAGPREDGVGFLVSARLPLG